VAREPAPAITPDNPEPDGVPASKIGAPVQNLSGPDILRTYHQGVMAGTDCSSPPVQLDPTNGVALHTDGRDECAALSNPVTYGAGFFEARIWFDGGSKSSIANWPAFYMVGNPWPSAGEIDAAEGMDGCLQLTNAAMIEPARPEGRRRAQRQRPSGIPGLSG
jgi:hypothetical protein